MIKHRSSLFLGLLGAEERGLDLSNAVLSVICVLKLFSIILKQYIKYNFKHNVPLSSRDACTVPSLLVNGLLGLGLLSWIGADGGMGLGVHLLDVLGVDAGLEVKKLDLVR